MDPGREIRPRRIEGFGFALHGDEDILHEILRQRAIPQPLFPHGIDEPSVALVELGERLFVFLRDAPHQTLVFCAVHIRLAMSLADVIVFRVTSSISSMDASALLCLRARDKRSPGRSVSLALYTYGEGFQDTEQSIVDQPKGEKQDRLTGTNLSNLVSR